MLGKWEISITKRREVEYIVIIWNVLLFCAAWICCNFVSHLDLNSHNVTFGLSSLH